MMLYREFFACQRLSNSIYDERTVADPLARSVPRTRAATYEREVISFTIDRGDYLYIIARRIVAVRVARDRIVLLLTLAEVICYTYIIALRYY